MTVFDVAVFFFILHSSTDPIIAMVVIRPYRKAVRNLFNVVIGRNNTVGPTVAVIRL